MRILLSAVLLSIFISGCAVKKVAAPTAKIFTIDVKAGDWAPLELKSDTKIYVVGPHGPEPAIKVGETPDGKIILLAPPSVIIDQQEKEQQEQQDQSKPLVRAELGEQ